MKQRVVINWEQYWLEGQAIHERAKQSFRFQLGTETKENKEFIDRQYEEGIQFLREKKENYLPQGLIVRHKNRLYFLFCIKHTCKGTLLEQCYHDLWCNAYLLETRRELIKERQIYGPGYHGETMESMEEILRIMKPEELPVSFIKGCLYPEKTLIGYCSIWEQEEKLKKCQQCKGNQKNCNYCID